jgi:hypothetical protein
MRLRQHHRYDAPGPGRQANDYPSINAQKRKIGHKALTILTEQVSKRCFISVHLPGFLGGGK